MTTQPSTNQFKRVFSLNLNDFTHSQKWEKRKKKLSRANVCAKITFKSGFRTRKKNTNHPRRQTTTKKVISHECQLHYLSLWELPTRPCDQLIDAWPTGCLSGDWRRPCDSFIQDCFGSHSSEEKEERLINTPPALRAAATGTDHSAEGCVRVCVRAIAQVSRTWRRSHLVGPRRRLLSLPPRVSVPCPLH